jgi:hypothetical protein
MKNIIWDHFRRWYWVWVVCLVGTGAIEWGMSAVKDKFSVTCPLGMFMGPLLLLLDLQRGHNRPIAAMPVTARQVARAWWWAAVGLPALAMAVLTGVVFSGISWWRHDWSGFAQGAVFCLSNFLTTGAGFYALTGLPRSCADYSTWAMRIRGNFFGALFGLSFAGWLLFQDVNLTGIAGLGLLFAGSALTLMGWLNAEKLVYRHVLLPAGQTVPRNKGTARGAESYGGLGFLAQSLFIQTVWMGVMMIVAFAVVLPLINRFLQKTDSIDHMLEAFPIFYVLILWIMTFQIANFTMHIRYLRTMPVSTAKLAGVLVFTVAAAMLAVNYGACLLLSAVFQKALPVIAQNSLLHIAMVTTAVPLFVWQPFAVRTFAIMVAMMFGSAAAAMFLQGRIPLAVNLVGAPVILLGVYLVTKRLLEHNSHAYRPRAFQFGGWAGER